MQDIYKIRIQEKETQDEKIAIKAERDRMSDGEKRKELVVRNMLEKRMGKDRGRTVAL